MTATLESEPRVKIGDILRKLTTIATLPQVTTQIIKTVEDPRSTAQQLHKIVSHDPALVTRVLKVVNSAFYGLPGQIASIERAIVVLGLNGVKNIAVAASLGQLFRGAMLCEGVSAKDLWTHCVAVAITSRDLAKNLRIGNPDEAFLAGLIHDVGILVSLQIYPEKLRQVCEAARKGAGSFCDLERKIIGFDHQQLGKGLAEQWKFPRGCQLVAGYHHKPELANAGQDSMVSIVHVADTLCCHSKHGCNLTAAHQPMNDDLLVKLEMDPAKVALTTSHLDELVGQATAVLG